MKQHSIWLNISQPSKHGRAEAAPARGPQVDGDERAPQADIPGRGEKRIDLKISPIARAIFARLISGKNFSNTAMIWYCDTVGE